jgi:hypothetical protein
MWEPDFTSTSSVPIVSALVDPDYYVISICRPKTHNCQVLTGVNKNILMGAPLTLSKQLMHGQDGWYSGTHTDEDKCLAYNLFQLGNVMFPTGNPALSVLDAWEGMQGNGPTGGTSIMQYCAVAGVDPLAVDRLCAKLMGFSDTATDPMDKNNPSYTDARALWWLSNAGLGNYDLSKINFISGSLAELETYVETYTLASTYTGTPSYQTMWTGGPPDSVLDPTRSIGDSHFLDPKPFLTPQVHAPVAGRQVSIEFSLPIGFSIHLAVYNLQGAEIRRLGHEYLPAGRYSIVWDRRDNHGTRVPSGRYLIRLGFDGRSMSDRLTLI